MSGEYQNTGEERFSTQLNGMMPHLYQEFHRILVTPNLEKNLTNYQERSSKCTFNSTYRKAVNCMLHSIASSLYSVNVCGLQNIFLCDSYIIFHDFPCAFLECFLEVLASTYGPYGPGALILWSNALKSNMLQEHYLSALCSRCMFHLQYLLLLCKTIMQ